MYCGEPLPETEAALDAQVPVLRPLEEWERGFNVVLVPLDREATDREIERLAEVAAMEESLARTVLAWRAPVPVARVVSDREAEQVVRLLDAASLAATIVPDADLGLERTIRRARSLRFGEDRLEVLVFLGDWVSLDRGDIVLAVEGRVTSTRVDIVEAAGQKRKRELVETSEYFSELFVIDIYGPSLEESVRIRAEGFDFGCLGGRPAPFVEANVNRLVEELSRYVGPSRFDSGFRETAKLLGHAWPPAARSSSRGLAVRGDFKRYTVSAVETDALSQFTRYSRLRYRLSP